MTPNEAREELVELMHPIHGDIVGERIDALVAAIREEEREKYARLMDEEAAKGRYPEAMRLCAQFVRTRSLTLPEETR